MSLRGIILGISGAVALAAVGNPAQAAVISAAPNSTLSTTPLVVSFNGVAEFAFTAASTGFGPGAAVATTGTGQVTTIGGAVTDFFAGASIDQTGELYTFSAYPTASTIPISAADDLIGLAFTLSDGLHYGYAEVAGPDLVSVGFNTTAGASIIAGATGTGSGITFAAATTGGGGGGGGGTVTSTPEPASLALLLGGLLTIPMMRRRIG